MALIEWGNHSKKKKSWGEGRGKEKRKNWKKSE